MRYAIDPSFIHQELGWLPETKFEDGIPKTIKWYLDNRSWWEEIVSGAYQDYYAKNVWKPVNIVKLLSNTGCPVPERFPVSGMSKGGLQHENICNRRGRAARP